MGWKLRKDKLRAEAEPAPEAETTPADAFPAAAAPDTAPAAPDTEPITLNPLPFETANEDVPPVVFDIDPTAFAPLPSAPNGKGDAGDEPLHFSASDPIALSPDGETEADESAAFDPLSFAPASDLDDAPVFGLDSVYVSDTEEDAPIFALGTDAPIFAMGTATDDAPVFAMGTDAPLFAMGTDSSDPLPDDAADALPIETQSIDIMPMTGPAAEDASGAFAPYQPGGGEPLTLGTAADEADYEDPDMEVGAMAFNPQSPDLGTFSPDAPTAGEEIADEPSAPAFADPSDTAEPIAFAPSDTAEPIAFETGDTPSPMTFEPSFEAPDALAGTATAPDSEADPNAPFMDRDALAAGLVSVEGVSGLPRVAPFVLPGEAAADFSAEPSGPRAMTVRLGSLSATYPLVKPVTTIGRPDTQTHTYPDIELDLDDGVSRRHAEVRLEEDAAYLVDVGSTNGTILNGTLLVPHQPAALQHGDRIRIGERVEMTFE